MGALLSSSTNSEVPRSRVARHNTETLTHVGDQRLTNNNNMTKQKIVIKVQMTCDKCRRNALALAGSTYGVISVAVEGEERDQLVVIGDGVDATNLTSCLRKTVKTGRADIITVEPVADEKPAETTTSTTTPACEAVEWTPAHGYNPYYHPGYGYYCPRTGVFYPYVAAGHCYVEDSNEGMGCTIM